MREDHSIVELKEKSPGDVSVWMAAMWTGYRKELLGAGMSEEAAAQNIERNRSQLFVGDGLVEGQYVLDVVDNGETVGTLWLSESSPQNSGEWFIYDIVVDEAHRGKGLGRLTMLAAEDFVAAHGGTRIALNVFGPNRVARNLYESMDYQVRSVGMYKDL
jgi:ribosomal protein S18 acetylase RimI-like enzyme